jgi:hypothetical protein
VTEESIVDRIEDAASKSIFVIVDLEGAASLLISYAIASADFVVTCTSCGERFAPKRNGCALLFEGLQAASLSTTAIL